MATANTNTVVPSEAKMSEMNSRFAPAPLEVDLSHLSPGDRKALATLVEAGRIVDRIFLNQIWSGNDALAEELEGDQRHLFWISKGPWWPLDGREPFVAGVPERRPPGANFYPEDMSREEFEKWVAGLPQNEATAARSFFTVIRRDPESKRLHSVPYRTEYGPDLEALASLLRRAAEETENVTLRHFLETRAKGLLTDDYFESDVAWMDMDARLDVTIGPYETYQDEIFGYKAAYEAYICVTDQVETDKVKGLSEHLQEVENSLPIPAEFRNPKLGATTPIRVVNEVLSAGDGNHGVQTAAFNLPNDERVIVQKGSKKVMLKNVQEAKFNLTLKPIARAVLRRDAQSELSFEWFFNHILAHELSHGIGPHEIKVDGKSTSVRLQLKELYSTIEEAKADITGLFMLQRFFDTEVMKGGDEAEQKLYTTFLASAFRSLRFGLHEAHGRGMALQMNYLLDRGAFMVHPDGRFSVNRNKMRPAVRDLTHELLMLEAEGDYGYAQRMLAKYGVIRPEVQEVLSRIANVPVDIEPVFVTADQLGKDARTD